MGPTRRLQVVSAVLAVVLLAAAWLLTRDDDGTPAASSSSTSTTTSTTQPSTVTDPSSTTEPKVSTEASRRGVKFTDVTKAAGLDAPRQDPRPDPFPFDRYSGGAAVADYDGDGDQDVFLPRLGLPNRLMQNDGRGHFTDVAQTAGVAGADQRNGWASALFGDVDGDADVDLFLTGAGTGAAVLYRNDGGRFTDITQAAGLAGQSGGEPLGTVSFGSAMADWNNDGSLDLVVLHWYLDPLTAQLLRQPPLSEIQEPRSQCKLAQERNAAPSADPPKSRTRLFQNDGKGHFTDVTRASGVDGDHIIGIQPLFTDINGDGWTDLFITGDFCTSRIYRNDRGHFVDITRTAGVGTDENGMGSVLEDIDGDGNLDWFVTSIAGVAKGACPDDVTLRCSGNRLYLGDGAGRFTDATDRFGVRDGSWAWGTAAQDFDDDGRRDLVLTNGLSGIPRADDAETADIRALHTDMARFYLGDEGSPWEDAAASIGLTDTSSGKALVPFDADGDGDLDLLIVSDDASPSLYRNDTKQTAARHRLTIRLRQPGPNPYAIGARVLIDRGDGSKPEPTEVRAGGSYGNSDPTDLHVGLGKVDSVARIEIRWPGVEQPQVLTDVPADQVLTVTRPG